MEILQTVANKLKSNFASRLKEELIIRDYGLKSCAGRTFKSYNDNKLEILFIDNLCYINLNDNQLRKIKSGNYKNLFVRKAYSGKLEDILLQDSIIINNTTIINNTVIGGNDEWLTTEF